MLDVVFFSALFQRFASFDLIWALHSASLPLLVSSRQRMSKGFALQALEGELRTGGRQQYVCIPSIVVEGLIMFSRGSD